MICFPPLPHTHTHTYTHTCARTHTNTPAQTIFQNYHNGKNVGERDLFNIHRVNHGQVLKLYRRIKPSQPAISKLTERNSSQIHSRPAGPDRKRGGSKMAPVNGKMPGRANKPVMINASTYHSNGRKEFIHGDETREEGQLFAG